MLLTVASPMLHSAEHTARDISFELQAYPTGVIPGIRFEYAFNDQQAVHVRLGVQEIRHGDHGEHDDERGDGHGFSLGYKRYFKPGLTGASVSFRTDLWFNSLDWRDDIGLTTERRGHTDVTVIQPTVEISWHHPLGTQFFITPSLGAGFEINIDTDGEDVGEGFIYLAGVLLGMRF